MRRIAVFLALVALTACLPVAGTDGAGDTAATLPFGEVGKVCGVPRGALGKQVDRFPKEGRTAWRLYDSNPATTGPRNQYITGFSDGCARQFTAALALFGSPGLHETHRYAAAQSRVPYSKADTAYEDIKGRVCGVAKGQPCPEARLRSLERGTSFVSVYRRFGDTSDWMEMLLHNGQLVVSERR